MAFLIREIFRLQSSGLANSNEIYCINGAQVSSGSHEILISLPNRLHHVTIAFEKATSKIRINYSRRQVLAVKSIAKQSKRMIN